MVRSLLFMFIIMMTAGTGMAEDVSPCSLGEVPVQLIYRNSEPVTTLSEANIHSTLPGFSSFATAITEHLAIKLAQEKSCLDNDESKERSLLQFAPRPGNSARQPLPSVSPFDAQSFSICRITSPWVELVIERKPVPSIRGIFIYSERQLLADQAVLAGAHNVPHGVAVPLDHKEFARYAMEYASSEIRHKPAKKPVEERVPPDLLWLFRRAGHDPVYPFSDLASGSMGKAMEMSAENYTKIVIKLIDRCFESDDEVTIHYNSIIDIDDPVLLEQYKIDSSIVQMPEH